MSPAARRLGCLLALCLGCAPEQHPETVGCRSLSDCDIFEVCDVPAAKCVPIPASGFKGSFACEVRAQGDAVTSLPGSEVFGSVGGFEWSLPVGASCQLFDLSAGGTALEVTVLQSVGFDALTATVDVAQAAGGWVAVDQTRVFGAPNSATLYTPDISSAIAHSAGGFLTFDRAPERGALVRGYLDLAMHEVVDADVLFGVPCPRGLADCGRTLSSLGGASACMPITFQSGEVHDVCTRSCATDADCAAGKGICNITECSIPCVSDDQCAPPLLCVAGNPGQSKGCF